MSDDIEAAVKRYDAGNAWDDRAEIVEAEVRQPLDKIVPVRLSAEKWAALRREAAELGVGPSTLARMWILERLRTLAAGNAAPPAARTGGRTMDDGSDGA